MENSPSSSSHLHSKARVPLIHFIGKRSNAKTSNAKNEHQISLPAKKNPTFVSILPTKESNGLDFITLKDQAFFGRPKLSTKEIDAIESGGATM